MQAQVSRCAAVQRAIDPREVIELAELLDRYRPPRLNPAGVCEWCPTRGCDSPDCKAMHERSVWMPCPVCLGFAVGCSDCRLGVVEVPGTRETMTTEELREWAQWIATLPTTQESPVWWVRQR